MTVADMAGLLGLWRETDRGSAVLINLSENHTFRVDTPRGPFILRVHRPGYQSADSIGSELAWLAALRGQLPVPQPLAGRDGRLVQRAGNRHAVLFAHEPGVEPQEDGDLVPLFGTLGRYAATAHRQVRDWQLPDGFTRQRWTIASMLDPDGLWGDWRVAVGVDGATRTALDAVDRHLRDQLGAYGEGRDRYGLIHADMRLANLLVTGDRVTLIDFDDCGFAWFVYDLAASLSFIELRADLEALVAAWLEGYRRVRSLTADDVAIVPAMILLRRMVLLAWTASHAEVPLARRHAPTFAADTVTLAHRLGVLG